MGPFNSQSSSTPLLLPTSCPASKTSSKPGSGGLKRPQERGAWVTRGAHCCRLLPCVLGQVYLVSTSLGLELRRLSRGPVLPVSDPSRGLREGRRRPRCPPHGHSSHHHPRSHCPHALHSGGPPRQAPQAPEAPDIGTTQDPGSVAVHGLPQSCTGHGQSQLQERAQLRPHVALCRPLKMAPKDTHAPTPGTWMSLI